MRPKILIRTDGSPQIGFGHLVRCLALAQMLKDDFTVTFFCREIPDTMIPELAKKGFSFLRISDEDQFINQIRFKTIVVLDGYHFDNEYQKKIKAIGCKLVCIADLYDKEYYADLIINHAPGVKPEDYKSQPYTQLAIGPEYALLRPAFLEQAKKQRRIEKIETVMICFGGSDFKNLTASTLKIVAGFNRFEKIIIVSGSAYNYPDSLNLLMNKDKRIIHYKSVDEKQMLSIMLESDLAIVPASGILLEVMAAGCISISGMSAENQKFVYDGYKNSDSIIDAINFNEVDLKKAIEKSFKINIEQKKIIDGRSGTRLLELFVQSNLKEKIKLREANNGDEKITYQWAINPVVRAYSFNRHLITKEEHTSWFHNKLRDINCLYLIAEMDNIKVGSIRFDFNGTEAIISYLVDPEYQGKGLGQKILICGIEYISEVAEKFDFNLQKIVGYVMEANIPSIKTFERLGFKKYEEEDKLKFEMTI